MKKRGREIDGDRGREGERKGKMERKEEGERQREEDRVGEVEEGEREERGKTGMQVASWPGTCDLLPGLVSKSCPHSSFQDFTLSAASPGASSSPVGLWGLCVRPLHSPSLKRHDKRVGRNAHFL